ncbi:hypothetical protein [Paenibacillus lemnae]|uniref:Group-specific protein n=1 Tax=Paenibacillus lemnae TaxID=1330551 RepID=A0A848M5S7_PAELE|nr:hypothetical protein [Paenibacillus lemnae]NMO96105.1 hypothetical protein [Paenibacillus lemnae]
MFHPTIFDNLKVALENIIYDLDNLDSQVLVTGREDILNMADMSRSISIMFEPVPAEGISAEVCLQASLKDLAAELLETPGEEPGCHLTLRFYIQICEEKQTCSAIEKLLYDIWNLHLPPVQILSHHFGDAPGIVNNKIEIAFPQQINENNMSDLPDMVEHMLITIKKLAPFSKA